MYLRISLTSFFLMDIIVYLVYGKTSDAIRNTIPETRATFLSLFSSVFLLPYSFPQAIQPIPKPNPPFGDKCYSCKDKKDNQERTHFFTITKINVAVVYKSVSKMQLKQYCS